MDTLDHPVSEMCQLLISAQEKNQIFQEGLWSYWESDQEIHVRLKITTLSSNTPI